MSNTASENRTFAQIFCNSMELCNIQKFVSIKKLQKQVKIEYATAFKVFCAFVLIDCIGDKSVFGYKFFISDELCKSLTENCNYEYEYLMLFEQEKQFKEMTIKEYLKSFILPSLMIGLSHGNLSVRFLQKKMSLGYQRANEIFDILRVIGFCGEEDEYHPSRNKLAISMQDYDKLYYRVESMND